MELFKTERGFFNSCISMKYSRYAVSRFIIGMFGLPGQIDLEMARLITESIGLC